MPHGLNSRKSLGGTVAIGSDPLPKKVHEYGWITRLNKTVFFHEAHEIKTNVTMAQFYLICFFSSRGIDSLAVFAGVGVKKVKAIRIFIFFLLQPYRKSVCLYQKDFSILSTDPPVSVTNKKLQQPIWF